MALYEGNSLVGWSEEYVNSINVLRNYVEELERKTAITPREFCKYNLLIECQRIMGETSKSCIRTMLKKNMFNIAELTDSFVLLEPYLFNARPSNNKKRA